MTQDTCTSSTAQHKRGASFDVSGQINVQDNGSPLLDLTGWTGSCELRTPSGKFIADLGFAWIDATQRLCRLHADSTSTWPLGLAVLDIKLINAAGQSVITDTAQLNIIKGVTQ